MIIKNGDCRNIALSKMLQNLDINLSPEMCFGLGECYDFKYWIEKTSTFPIIIIMGRNYDGEVNLLKNINFDVNTIGDPNKSVEINMLEIDQILKEQKDVLVNVDRYYLNYLNNNFNQYHCGWHSILVEDSLVDNDGLKIYKVFEPLLDESKNISYQDIAIARSSKCIPYSPDFYGLYINGKSENRDLDFTTVSKIINRNMLTFLNEEKGGIFYLKKFRNNISCLHDKSIVNKNSVYIKLQLNFMSKYILEYENTKSFYRKVYAQFLDKIDKKFKLSSLDIVKKNFELLGAEWNDLGCLMNDYDKNLSSEYISKIECCIDSIINNEKTSAKELLLKINCY